MSAGFLESLPPPPVSPARPGAPVKLPGPKSTLVFCIFRRACQASWALLTDTEVQSYKDRSITCIAGARLKRKAMQEERSTLPALQSDRLARTVQAARDSGTTGAEAATTPHAPPVIDVIVGSTKPDATHDTRSGAHPISVDVLESRLATCSVMKVAADFKRNSCTFQHPIAADLPREVIYPTLCRGMCTTGTHDKAALLLQERFFDKLSELCPPNKVQSDLLMSFQTFASDWHQA